MSWHFKKAIVVHAPDSNVGCVTRLRVAYDESANQGAISVSITTNLANITESQTLTLSIYPEIVETCSVTLSDNDHPIPPHIFKMLPAPVGNASAVCTMSLCLKTTAVIIGPLKTVTLSPAERNDVKFHAFTKICQAKLLYLHFAKRQFASEELSQLQVFSNTLHAHGMQTQHIDKTRANAGQGAEERDWGEFDLPPDLPPNPPPYK